MKSKVCNATGWLLTSQCLILTTFLTLAMLLFIVGCAGPGAPAPTNPPPVDSTRPGMADLPPEQRADYYQAKPEITIDTNKTYRATIQTSKGDIVVSLDAKAAPEHVNNFIFLSNEGFYDGLTFHRVEPGFVIQGGDPLGAGNGGPGYTVPGEFSLKHVEGALAMARLPDQVNPDRESSGSQFYITLAQTEFLDGEYSVFGKVEQGMDVVRSIQVGDTINQIVVEP
jgi:cyclophilin family peptidyl-prolyl cis-trans isomerase